MAHARGGQILCTASVAEAGSSVEDVRFQPIGSVAFKNVVDPVTLFEVLAGAGAGESVAIDPVCRMQVRPESAPARLPFAGKIYFFCSFDFARSFTERPERYAVR